MSLIFSKPVLKAKVGSTRNSIVTVRKSGFWRTFLQMAGSEVLLRPSQGHSQSLVAHTFSCLSHFFCLCRTNLFELFGWLSSISFKFRDVRLVDPVSAHQFHVSNLRFNGTTLSENSSNFGGNFLVYIQKLFSCEFSWNSINSNTSNLLRINNHQNLIYRANFKFNHWT